jgi:hypothetical protein
MMTGYSLIMSFPCLDPSAQGKGFAFAYGYKRGLNQLLESPTG